MVSLTRACRSSGEKGNDVAEPTASKKVKVPVTLNPGDVPAAARDADKDYAPPKRPRALSESPIPDFDVDSDGQEIVPKLSLVESHTAIKTLFLTPFRISEGGLSQSHHQKVKMGAVIQNGYGNVQRCPVIALSINGRIQGKSKE